MDRKERIEQEVKKTLQCLDQFEPIKSNPFFYTRLQTRINSLNKKQERSIFSVFIESYLQPAFLVSIVAINMVSAIYFFKNTEYRADNRGENIATLAKEYSLIRNNYSFFITNE